MIRRDFLRNSAALAAAAMAPKFLAEAKAGQKYKIGYAAITWGGKDEQAIADISSLGYRHIQLRANTYKTYNEKRDELKALLKRHNLSFSVMSSGSLNPGRDEAGQMKMHLDHAGFAKALGVKFLQVTNSARVGEGKQDPALVKAYARLLTDLGKQVADKGLTLVYHNHMHQLGETPEEVDMILQESDERYVKLLLDIAHYHKGGGDPSRAFSQYASRTKVLHLKDWTESEGKHGYKFCELGQGHVDLPAFFNTLAREKFNGLAMVELDGVPVAGRTPKECAQISKDFLLKQNLAL